MKKSVYLLLTAVLFLFLLPSNAYAATAPALDTISENGEDYIVETILIGETPERPSETVFADTQTITRTKISYVRNSDGDVLWYLSITATFEYNGSTSKCISCSCDAVSQNSSWNIKSYSCSKSGNSATATATATHTSPLGLSQDYTQSVTIRCSANGTVS